MFGFLRKRRSLAPRERQIFRYWDGTRERGADPIAVMRVIYGHPQFDPEVDPELAASVGDERSIQNCLQVVRDAFAVEDWKQDEHGDRGLTQMEMFALLRSYGEYQEALKKNMGVLPTSSNATASTASSVPPPPTTAESAPITKPSSDSTSTSTAAD